jgi:hypothetical protein
MYAFSCTVFSEPEGDFPHPHHLLGRVISRLIIHLETFGSVPLVFVMVGNNGWDGIFYPVRNA